MTRPSSTQFKPRSWEAWILWALENEPDRIFDPIERELWQRGYWAANPRAEERQWHKWYARQRRAYLEPENAA